MFVMRSVSRPCGEKHIQLPSFDGIPRNFRSGNNFSEVPYLKAPFGVISNGRFPAFQRSEPSRSTFCGRGATGSPDPAPAGDCGKVRGAAYRVPCHSGETLMGSLFLGKWQDYSPATFATVSKNGIRCTVCSRYHSRKCRHCFECTQRPQLQADDVPVKSNDTASTIVNEVDKVAHTLGLLKPIAFTRLFTALLYAESVGDAVQALIEASETYGLLYTALPGQVLTILGDTCMRAVCYLNSFFSQKAPTLQAFEVENQTKLDGFANFFKMFGLSGSPDACGLTISVIALALTALVMTTGTVLTMTDDWLGKTVKKLGLIGRSVQGITTLVTTFQKIWTWASSLLASCVGLKYINDNDSSIKQIKLAISEVQSEALQLAQALSVDPSALYYNEKGFAKLQVVITRAQGIIKDSLMHEKNITNSRVVIDSISNSLKELLHIRQTFLSNILPVKDPVCVWLAGEAGRGKTTLSETLSRDILARFGWSGGIYERNFADDFWSAYSQQPIVQMDDLLQRAEHDDHLQFMMAVGSGKARLNMASLDEKGMLLKASLIMCTSNQAYIAKSKKITTTEAFHRRRHFVIWVDSPIIAEYAKQHGAMPYYGALLDGEPVFQEDWSHVQMTQIPALPPGRWRPGTIEGITPVEEDLTYSVLLEKICSQIELNERLYEKKVATALKLVAQDALVVADLLTKLASVEVSVQSPPTNATLDELAADILHMRGEVKRSRARTDLSRTSSVGVLSTISDVSTPSARSQESSASSSQTRTGWIFEKAEQERLTFGDVEIEEIEQENIPKAWQPLGGPCPRIALNDWEGEDDPDWDFFSGEAPALQALDAPIMPFLQVADCPECPMFFLHGPAGTGKSWTLYALKAWLTEQHIHYASITTLEEEVPDTQVLLVDDFTATNWGAEELTNWVIQTYAAASTPDRLFQLRLVVVAGNMERLLLKFRNAPAETRNAFWRRWTFVSYDFRRKAWFGQEWGQRYTSEEARKMLREEGTAHSKIVCCRMYTQGDPCGNILRNPKVTTATDVIDHVRFVDCSPKHLAVYTNLPRIGDTTDVRGVVTLTCTLTAFGQVLNNLTTGEGPLSVMSKLSKCISFKETHKAMFTSWLLRIQGKVNITINDHTTVENLLIQLNNARICIGTDITLKIMASDVTVLVTANQRGIMTIFVVISTALMPSTNEMLLLNGYTTTRVKMTPQELAFYDEFQGLLAGQTHVRPLLGRMVKASIAVPAFAHSLADLTNALDEEFFHLTMVTGKEVMKCYTTLEALLSVAWVALQIAAAGWTMFGTFQKARDRFQLKDEIAFLRDKISNLTPENEAYVYNPDYNPNWRQEKMRDPKAYGKYMSKVRSLGRAQYQKGKGGKMVRMDTQDVGDVRPGDEYEPGGNWGDYLDDMDFEATQSVGTQHELHPVAIKNVKCDGAVFPSLAEAMQGVNRKTQIARLTAVYTQIAKKERIRSQYAGLSFFVEWADKGHLARDVSVVLTKVFAPVLESVDDASLFNGTIPVVKKNLVSMRLSGVHIVWGLMIGGVIGVTCAHPAVRSKAKYMCFTQEKASYEIEVLHSSIEDDIFIFRVLKATKQWPNILKHLQTKEEAAMRDRQRAILLVRARDPAPDAPITVDNHFYHVKLGERRRIVPQEMTVAQNMQQFTPESYGYSFLQSDIDTVKGDCGSPLLLRDSRFPRKIIGFHCSATTTVGYASILCQEDVQPFLIETQSADTPLTVYRFDKVELSDPKIAPGFDRVKHLGRITENDFQPLKTPFIRSPLHLEPEGDIPLMEPSVLNTGDARLPQGFVSDILYDRLRAFDSPEPQIDMAKLHESVDCWTQEFARVFMENHTHVRVLTTNEAINATTTTTNSHSVQMSTSPGFPWRTYPGVKGKKPFIDYKEDGYPGQKVISNSAPGQDLRFAVDRVIDNAREGGKMCITFSTGLKDEIVSRSKVREEPKTRMYMGCPLHLLLAMRQYTHLVAAGISRYRRFLPPQIGFNPHSLEFDYLVRELEAVSPYVVELDFSGWDSTIPLAFMREVIEVYNVCMKECDPYWKVEDDIVRRNLHDYLCSPMVIADGQILQLPKGQPSGEPNTATTNSIVGCYLIYYVYLCCAEKANKKEEKSFKFFLEKVVLKNCGDDCILAIHPDLLEWFNGHTISSEFAKLGMKCTSATDKDQPPEKFKTIREMSFLARSPVKIDGVWHGALRESTMLKLMGWTRNTKHQEFGDRLLPYVTTFEENVIESTIRSAAYEYVHFGPREYFWFREHVRRAGQRYGFVTRPDSYASLLEEMEFVPLGDALPIRTWPATSAPDWFKKRWGESLGTLPRVHFESSNVRKRKSQWQRKKEKKGLECLPSAPGLPPKMPLRPILQSQRLPAWTLEKQLLQQERSTLRIHTFTSTGKSKQRQLGQQANSREHNSLSCESTLWSVLRCMLISVNHTMCGREVLTSKSSLQLQTSTAESCVGLDIHPTWIPQNITPCQTSAPSITKCVMCERKQTSTVRLLINDSSSTTIWTTRPWEVSEVILPCTFSMSLEWQIQEETKFHLPLCQSGPLICSSPRLYQEELQSDHLTHNLRYRPELTKFGPLGVSYQKERDIVGPSNGWCSLLRRAFQSFWIVTGTAPMPSEENPCLTGTTLSMQSTAEIHPIPVDSTPGQVSFTLTTTPFLILLMELFHCGQTQRMGPCYTQLVPQIPISRPFVRCLWTTQTIIFVLSLLALVTLYIHLWGSMRFSGPLALVNRRIPKGMLLSVVMYQRVLRERFSRRMAYMCYKWSRPNLTTGLNKPMLQACQRVLLCSHLLMWTRLCQTAWKAYIECSFQTMLALCGMPMQLCGRIGKHVCCKSPILRPLCRWLISSCIRTGLSLLHHLRLTNILTSRKSPFLFNHGCVTQTQFQALGPRKLCAIDSCYEEPDTGKCNERTMGRRTTRSGMATKFTLNRKTKISDYGGDEIQCRRHSQRSGWSGFKFSRFSGVVCDSGWSWTGIESDWSSVLQEQSTERCRREATIYRSDGQPLRSTGFAGLLGLWWWFWLNWFRFNTTSLSDVGGQQLSNFLAAGRNNHAWDDPSECPIWLGEPWDCDRINLARFIPRIVNSRRKTAILAVCFVRLWLTLKCLPILRIPFLTCKMWLLKLLEFFLYIPFRFLALLLIAKLFGVVALVLYKLPTKIRPRLVQPLCYLIGCCLRVMVNSAPSWATMWKSTFQVSIPSEFFWRYTSQTLLTSPRIRWSRITHERLLPNLEVMLTPQLKLSLSYPMFTTQEVVPTFLLHLPQISLPTDSDHSLPLSFPFDVLLENVMGMYCLLMSQASLLSSYATQEGVQSLSWLQPVTMMMVSREWRERFLDDCLSNISLPQNDPTNTSVVWKSTVQQQKDVMATIRAYHELYYVRSTVLKYSDGHVLTSGRCLATSLETYQQMRTMLKKYFFVRTNGVLSIYPSGVEGLDEELN